MDLASVPALTTDAVSRDCISVMAPARLTRNSSREVSKMAFPENDKDFAERKIDEVQELPKGGWEIKHDGWCFFVQSDSQIVPELGMVARFYRKGFGSRVRGLFLDGIEVFY